MCQASASFFLAADGSRALHSPGPTEGSWSTSPTRSRRLVGCVGRARTQLARPTSSRLGRADVVQEAARWCARQPERRAGVDVTERQTRMLSAATRHWRDDREISITTLRPHHRSVAPSPTRPEGPDCRDISGTLGICNLTARLALRFFCLPHCCREKDSSTPKFRLSKDADCDGGMGIKSGSASRGPWAGALPTTGEVSCSLTQPRQ